MKHNENKIELLNSSASNYYHAIDNRSYVHSTTIISHIFETLKSNEVTLCLHKMIKSGYIFSDYPEESDLGSALIDNTVLFIKSNDNIISPVKVEDCGQYQQKLMKVQNSVIDSGRIYVEDKKENNNVSILSKKVWIHTSRINEINIDNITFNTGMFNSYVFSEVSYNNFSFWKQYGVPVKRV